MRTPRATHWESVRSKKYQKKTNNHQGGTNAENLLRGVKFVKSVPLCAWESFCSALRKIPLKRYANPILRLEESQRGVRILSKRKRGMLLEVRFVLTVPLRYEFKPTSPRDADTANTLFLVVCSAPAVCEPYRFVPSDCDIKTNTILEGWCSFLWRRKRDSNPRAFWANGFQDFLESWSVQVTLWRLGSFQFP